MRVFRIVVWPILMVLFVATLCGVSTLMQWIGDSVALKVAIYPLFVVLCLAAMLAIIMAIDWLDPVK